MLSDLQQFLTGFSDMAHVPVPVAVLFFLAVITVIAVGVGAYVKHR